MSPWLKLTPSEFEEMILHVLRREGFHNVSWYGESGLDSGRDITCERTELLGTRVVNYRCIIQCKLYKGSVPRSQLHEELAKASAFSPHYYILATTGVLGATTKDWLTAQRDNFGFSIVLWERTDIEVLLERHQDVRTRFLGIPTDESYVLTQLSERYKGFASIVELAHRAGSSHDARAKLGPCRPDKDETYDCTFILYND